MQISPLRLSAAFLGARLPSRTREGEARLLGLCTQGFFTHLIRHIISGSGEIFPTRLELANVASS